MAFHSTCNVVILAFIAHVITDFCHPFFDLNRPVDNRLRLIKIGNYE